MVTTVTSLLRKNVTTMVINHLLNINISVNTCKPLHDKYGYNYGFSYETRNRKGSQDEARLQVAQGLAALEDAKRCGCLENIR